MSQRKHHRVLLAGAMIIVVSMITACSQAAAPTMTAVLPPSLTTPLPSATTPQQSTATLDPMSLLTNLPAYTSVVQSPTPRPSATPSPILPTPEPDMRYAPADMREDIAFLFRTLEEVHPNLYTTLPKAQLDQQRQALEASLTEPLTRSELFLRLVPLITQLNDGHTYLLAPEESYGEHLAKGGLILPLRLMLADQQAWVIDHTDAATTIPLGAEVTAINDIPMHTIIAAMLSLESGERQAHRLIRVQQEFDLLLWLLYHWEPPYTIRYRIAPDAAETQVMVTGSSERERQAIADPQQRDMRIAPYTFAIRDTNIGLIDFRSFRELERFEPFLEETFTNIQQAGIRHLMIVGPPHFLPYCTGTLESTGVFA